jgi:hypothetical protein
MIAHVLDSSKSLNVKVWQLDLVYGCHEHFLKESSYKITSFLGMMEIEDWDQKLENGKNKQLNMNLL